MQSQGGSKESSGRETSGAVERRFDFSQSDVREIGQVLSSRQDLIPKAYVKELRELQDNVPPFDDELARQS